MITITGIRKSGKTTSAFKLARTYGKPVYIISNTREHSRVIRDLYGEEHNRAMAVSDIEKSFLSGTEASVVVFDECDVSHHLQMELTHRNHTLIQTKTIDVPEVTPYIPNKSDKLTRNFDIVNASYVKKLEKRIEDLEYDNKVARAKLSMIIAKVGFNRDELEEAIKELNK